MAHVLVVGGTGMLKDVSLFLAQHDNIVSVIARNDQKLNSLCTAAEGMELKGRINPIQLDYRDTNRLTNALNAASDQYGPLVMVINWVAPEDLAVSDTIAEIVNARSPICRFFQILNHDEVALPEAMDYFHQPYTDLARVLYRTITIGLAVEEGGLTRLLNAHEVCNGIIDAIRNDKRNLVIGSTEASGARPQSA